VLTDLILPMVRFKYAKFQHAKIEGVRVICCNELEVRGF
jgi:hypothetical protein